MKLPQNTPPLMAGMNAVQGQGGMQSPSLLFKMLCGSPQGASLDKVLILQVEYIQWLFLCVNEI
jgi:hypothetical protein